MFISRLQSSQYNGSLTQYMKSYGSPGGPDSVFAFCLACEQALGSTKGLFTGYLLFFTFRFLFFTFSFLFFTFQFFVLNVLIFTSSFCLSIEISVFILSFSVFVFNVLIFTSSFCFLVLVLILIAVSKFSFAQLCC